MNDLTSDGDELVNANVNTIDTIMQNAFISPANEAPYLDPFAVLTGSDSASAAESFVIAMNALPNVTLVGENTQGIFPYVLGKSLPNGWEFSLSNEIYTDFIGKNYEAVVVPLNVDALAYSVEAIEQNTDFSINATLQTLGF